MDSDEAVVLSWQVVEISSWADGYLGGLEIELEVSKDLLEVCA